MQTEPIVIGEVQIGVPISLLAAMAALFFFGAAAIVWLLFRHSNLLTEVDKARPRLASIITWTFAALGCACLAFGLASFLGLFPWDDATFFRIYPLGVASQTDVLLGRPAITFPT